MGEQEKPEVHLFGLHCRIDRANERINRTHSRINKLKRRLLFMEILSAIAGLGAIGFILYRFWAS